MNEKILQALMKLFAIITDVRKERISGNARELVEDYLNRQFSRELAQDYLNYFDQYLDAYHRRGAGSQEAYQKQTALNSVKIIKICNEINAELQLEARVLTVVELLEFIKKEDAITDQELDFVQTASEYLQIDHEDYRNIQAFVLKPYGEVPDQSRLLLIDALEEGQGKLKHAYRKGLSGKLVILHIPPTDTLIFQYFGKANLYLNGHNIRVARTYVLSPGSVIRSSKVHPIYFSHVLRRFIQAEVKDKIILEAKNISYRFPNGHLGLHPFYFRSESGYLVAIMGSSGTGKSTLMNVLNGNLKNHSGQIFINGYDLHKSGEALEGVIGFVPQDDLLIEEFTVYQNLYYNARLCFDDFTEEQIQKEIDKALINFDLVEARNLKVGTKLTQQISGGQRKRLNIALELMREPSILFVDEPTSGLSSMDSEKVMLLLKRQTLKGKLVLVNLHQPSSDIYKLIDKVVIMDQGGRTVYNGNPSDAIIYFNQHGNYVNPQESECPLCGNIKTEQPLRVIEARVVDRYGRLIRERKVEPKEWYAIYRENEEKPVEPKQEKIPLPRNYFKIPDKMKQFGLFLRRNIHQKLQNRQYMLIALLEAPVLAFILSYFSKYIERTAGAIGEYVFYDNKNIPAFFFMSTIVSLFIGLIVSAEEIIKDRKILKREAFLNLSRGSYLNAKISTLFFLSAIQMLLYVLVSHAVLEIHNLFWQNWLVLFSIAFSANLLGLIISSSMQNLVNVYILIPFVLVPQLLLSGVVIHFNDMHPQITNERYVPLAGDLMGSRWGFEALIVNQYKNNQYNAPLFPYTLAIKTLNFEMAYRLPELQKRNAYCRKHAGDDSQQREVARNLRLLKNELHKLHTHPLIQANAFAAAAKLNLQDYTPAIAASLGNFLQKEREILGKREKHARARKDSVLKSQFKTLGREGLLARKNTHHNHAVELYVQDQLHLTKTIEAEEALIRRKDPIYMLPLSHAGRAHFYAPYKYLGPFRIATLYFNLLIIWLSVALFYIALYFDLLHRLIYYIEQITLRYSKWVVHKRV